MNNEFAFRLIKVLEMFALSKLKDVEQDQINDYAFILMLPSAPYAYHSEWTLVVQPNTNWLIEEGRKKALNELFSNFKENSLNDFSSNDFVKRITILDSQDEELKGIIRFNNFYRSEKKYINEMFNFELNGELINEAYLLKSKILDNIKFGKKLKILKRQVVEEGRIDIETSFYSSLVSECIFVGVDGFDLIVLNDDGIERYNKKAPLSNQKILSEDQFSERISLYDIFEII